MANGSGSSRASVDPVTAPAATPVLAAPGDPPAGFTISVQRLLIVAGLLLALSVGGAIATIGYHGLNDALRAATQEQFQTMRSLMQERSRRLVEPVRGQLGLLIYDPITRASNLAGRLSRVPILAASLRDNPTLVSVYAGYVSGEFILLRRIDSPAMRDRFEAPETAAYLAQTITRRADGSMDGAYHFFGPELDLISNVPQPDYRFDPRTRPWYQASATSRDAVTSPPYSFFTTGEVGITVSQQAPGGLAIIGMDATMRQLSAEVENLRLTAGTEIAIAEQDGTLIAYPDLTRITSLGPDGTVRRNSLDELGVPVLAELIKRYGLETEERTGTLFADGQTWFYSAGLLDLGTPTPVAALLAIPSAEMFAGTRAILRNQAIVIAIIVLLSVPVGLYIIRQITRPLKQVSEDVAQLAAFEFDEPVAVRTSVREAADLAATVERLRVTIQRFLSINRTIAAERDFDTLMVRLLDEIILTTRTEAGILYLSDADGERLVPHAARLDAARDLVYPVPDVLLTRGESLLRRCIRDENAEGTTVKAWELEALGLAKIADAMDDPPQHLLAAPLFNREHELVGVLLLFETDVMDPALVRFTEALSGSAAISIETRQLIQAQRELFESFIQLIASAIDAKSPYTGGHCARVPELTKMLASAADKSESGPFADFRLNDADWEAIHVASWLHDCGKVTTPEFVVDKATKLETIYDRIHEVRMRIEVMKREAELAYWKRAAERGEDAEAAKALEETLAQLDDDFAFLAECNVGGEFMSDERIARIRALAGKTWTRTLDDRLGVSHEEKARLDRTPPKPLPVQEPLLADRPDHLHARPEADRLPPDNRWGFKMDVPENLYNRGEIHNLSVRKGTLTDEDRFKINEHIVQTIKMLDRLPFPKHLRHVPELAGGHHEKMDGTGYPKRLMKEDMSDVARMMAIADIFEALTAVDRPYKKGKTLSEALRIMTFMVRDQHIDPDLFDLFLTSGVYMDYAKKFLQPEQIDDVDPEEYRVAG